MKTIEELTKIAALSKISLDGEDMNELIRHMADCMAVADRVKNADLTGLDCTPDREIAPMRPDILLPSCPVEELLRNAGGGQDGHYIADIGGRRSK